MDRMTLTIDGMTCGHCVNQVMKTLKELDGVNVEQVTIGEATVAYDPAATSEERIREAIADDGYTVVETAR